MTQPFDATTSGVHNEIMVDTSNDLQDNQTQPFYQISKVEPVVTTSLSSSSLPVAETFKHEHNTDDNNADYFNCACGQKENTIFDGVSFFFFAFSLHEFKALYSSSPIYLYIL